MVSIKVDSNLMHGIAFFQRSHINAFCSSVYLMDGDLLTRDGKPLSFSKEFARDMVKEKGQQFSDEQSNEIAVRYIQGLQHLTGEDFDPDLRLSLIHI